jgi:hypothetical protein
MKKQIMKNIIISIFALFFLFTYFQSEISMNAFNGDGTVIAGGSGIKPPVR